MSAIDTHGDHAADHDHPPFLAHHWENPQQQFEAGKLGMWLFLGTEFLLFGGLFCAYAVYRFNHPELFAYGSKFLNTTWGAVNTVVLILSSLTMAMSVTAAQMGRTRALVTLLSLTFLGGAVFMGVKYVEYKHKFEHNIVWGTGLYVPSDHDSHDGDHAAVMAGTAGTAGAAAVPAVAAIDEDNLNPTDLKSTVPPAAVGPSGLAKGAMTESDGDHAETPKDKPSEPNPRTDPERPANAHIFFGIYFCMTGLHGIHVLAGMGVIGWLIMRSARGEFGPGYFTPVDLGGLYWHVVDLIWIFLFPLLYLIG